MNVFDPDDSVPKVRVTDYREAPLEERLATPTTSGVYSHSGISLCTEAAEMIEALKADNQALRDDITTLNSLYDDLVVENAKLRQEAEQCQDDGK